MQLQLLVLGYNVSKLFMQVVCILNEMFLHHCVIMCIIMHVMMFMCVDNEVVPRTTLAQASTLSFYKNWLLKSL